MTSPELGFVFVCQAGELERKACLLAASLRDVYGSAATLTAAVPQPEQQWGSLAASTQRSLAQNEVFVAPITNPIGPHYPIGNKLGAALVAPSAEWVAVLDSDTLAVSPIDHDALTGDVAVKPVDRPGPWSNRRKWRRLYRRFGLKMPRWTVETSVSAETVPPYFNAGVVFSRAGSGFLGAWVEMARRIDADAGVEDRHPWLDQLALPLAAASLGLDVDVLDSRANYPAHYWLTQSEEPWFAHYHSAAVIEEDVRLLDRLRKLAWAGEGLDAVLSADGTWRRLLEREGPIPRSSLVVLTQTGSTSMTSLTAALRDQGANTVPLDPSFASRINREGASWIASWLRRAWLEHDPERGPVVLVDEEGVLGVHRKELERSLHGFTLAVLSGRAPLRDHEATYAPSSGLVELDATLGETELSAAVVRLLS